jgi:subtilisin family serine protease
MQGPIGPSWPGTGHARQEPPYQSWDGPRHFGHRPIGPFYPARDPEPYPLPRHRRPIPIIDEGGDVPPPRRLRHPVVVVPPVETATRHINTRHIDKKIVVVSHRSVARPSPAPALPPRPNSGLPVAAEHRFVPDEVLFELRPDVSPQIANTIVKRERLRQLASQRLALIGTTMYRAQIMGKRSLATVITALEADPRIAAVQPNYLYTLQGESSGGLVEAQYAIPKMHLAEAHAISNGAKTLVAVIDSGIDQTHPEISNTVKESFDADGTNGQPAVHGTAVAGIIAAHAELTGIAPQARVLAVRAFSPADAKSAARGTTYDIRTGIEWSEQHGARIVNMSFAGPQDAAMSRELADGARRGIIFIAPVGNEGNAAKALYPAADENVIAVTAIDQSDGIFKNANHCPVTCIAAPGVDIIVAEPGGFYGFLSGTSMAAAHVSGVVALLLDAKPDLTPNAVRDLLFKTAKHLDPGGQYQDSVAGVVDAYEALEAATTRFAVEAAPSKDVSAPKTLKVEAPGAKAN